MSPQPAARKRGSRTVVSEQQVRKKIDSAILRVQRAVPQLIKDQLNQYANYKYPDIDQYYATIVPIANKYGLRWVINTQNERVSPLIKDEIIVDVIVDLSFRGYWIPGFARLIMPHAAMGAQMGGSLVSYADKVFMRDVFKLRTGEGDADASDNTRPRSPPSGRSLPPAPRSPGTRKPQGVGPHEPVPPAEPPPPSWEPDPYGGIAMPPPARRLVLPEPEPEPAEPAPSWRPMSPARRARLEADGRAAEAWAAEHRADLGATSLYVPDGRWADLKTEVARALPEKKTLDEVMAYWDSMHSQLPEVEATDPPAYAAIVGMFVARKSDVKRPAGPRGRTFLPAKPVTRDFRANTIQFPRQAAAPRKPPGWGVS